MAVLERVIISLTTSIAMANRRDSIILEASSGLAHQTDWPLVLTNKQALLKELIDKVARRILPLVEYDIEALAQLLYRLDVHEHYMHEALARPAILDAAQELAHHIVERELQKAATRVSYREQEAAKQAA